jgi:hypothetical protein
MDQRKKGDNRVPSPHRPIAACISSTILPILPAHTTTMSPIIIGGTVAIDNVKTPTAEAANLLG